MKSKTKFNVSQLTLPELSTKGVELMAAGAYKDAIQVYKQLHKLEPDAAWISPLAAAYLARAKEIAAKKMYKEAALLWENMNALGEPASSQALYIDWLMRAGQSGKAVTAFIDLAADNPERGRLESLFAASMLAGDQAVLAALPADTDLKRQYVIAHSALESYCQGATAEHLHEQLQGISFRSPYKDLRQILNALLKLEDATVAEATELLARVAEDSPFISLVDAIRPSLLDSEAQFKALEPLSHHQREFVASLLGLDKQQLKLLRQLRPGKQDISTPKALHDFIVANVAVLDKERTRRACLSLLNHYPPSRKTYRRLFGPVSSFEAEKAAALFAEQHNDDFTAERHWMRCVELLRADKTDPYNPLKAAFILRHITDPLVKVFNQRGGYHFPPPILFDYLATSLELDPSDKASYLNLIELYDKSLDRKIYQQWVDKALARFPDDSEVLLAAIKAAKRKNAFKKAATYATTLLQRDPINKQARDLLIDAHLAHARKSIKNGKYHLAEKEFAAAEQLVRKPDGMIEINRGLMAVQQKQPEQAAQWLQQGVALSDSVLTATLRLHMEAGRLKLTPKQLQPQTYLSKLDQNALEREHVMSLIKLINHYQEENLSLQAALDALTVPLRRAVKGLTKESDLQALCDCLAGIAPIPYLLLADCAEIARKQWPQSSLFVYYQIYGRAKGYIRNVSDADYDRLEEAAEQAHEAKDVRTATRIDDFLDQGMSLGSAGARLPMPGPGGLPSMPAPLQALFDDLEDAPPAEKAAIMAELVAKITEVTGSEPPPDVIDMLDMLDEIDFEDDFDEPRLPFPLPLEGTNPFHDPFPFDPCQEQDQNLRKRKSLRKNAGDNQNLCQILMLCLRCPETASDDVIKKAYLEKVRAHPPERDPEQFQVIRSAYESIRSQADRLRYQLFYQQPPTLVELLSEAFALSESAGVYTRPPERLFQQVLMDGLNER